MRMAPGELAARLFEMAEGYEARAAATASSALDELGPTRSVQQQQNAAFLRKWAADIRDNVPILPRRRRFS